LDIDGVWTITASDDQTRHTTNSAAAQPVGPVPLRAAAASRHPEGSIIVATLPPVSWTVFRLCPVVGRDA
jgi:alpha-N-arabinofuranosidase